MQPPSQVDTGFGSSAIWDIVTGSGSSTPAEGQGEETGYKEMPDVRRNSKTLVIPSSTNKGISRISQRKVNESLVQYLLQQREAKLHKRIQKTNKQTPTTQWSCSGNVVFSISNIPSLQFRGRVRPRGIRHSATDCTSHSTPWKAGHFARW